jgi:hypothetical protein
MPTPKTQRAHCPACRAHRHVRIVGTATVARRPVSLTQCQAPGCELIWAVREGSLTGSRA